MKADIRDRRAEGRDAYRASVEDGAPLSACQLAEMFERSDRWGRQVIADAVAADRRNGHGPESERQPHADHPADSAAARKPKRPVLDSAITLAVGLVAALASYGHMLDVALWAGEPVWIARAFPIVRHEALVIMRVRDPPLVVVAAGRS